MCRRLRAQASPIGAARLINLHLTFALLVAPLLFATLTFAQSGRRTQPANPSSTQRPRRATTGTSSQSRPPDTNQQSTTATKSSGVQILPDDAPPAPAVKPKTPPKTVASNEPSDADFGPEDVVRISSNLVTVPASIVDPYGRAVMGLKLEDFELRVDGQVKAISDISYSDTPVRLALLFDNSSSLVTARDFEKQAAIRFFRTVMRPVDQAAVYNVYTEVELAQPLTSDVRALVRTVENFGKPEGATRLFDAIVQASNYLRPQAGRKVIVIVSDGEDTLSDTDFDEALRIAQAADCQIYAVQTKQIEYVMQTGQPLGNANLRALAAERRLQEFAAQTGGAVYSPLAVNELDAAFAQISADLAQQYILSYYPVDEKQDGRFRAISLRVTTHPDARVRARKGYYASKAGMKSSVNWQTTSMSVGATVNNINPSDTVPKDTGQRGDTSPPVSSSLTSATPAPEIRVASELPSDSTTTSQQQIASTQPPAAKPPQPSTQTPQPSSSPVTQPSTTEPPASTQTQTSTATRQNALPPKEVSGGVLNGKALSLPKPEYPATARAAGAFGTVIVEVTVDESGKVVAARAVSGNPLLRGAAIAAARQARFAPTKISGQPIKVSGVITYNFVTPR